ncbi:MAG: hypothetical protein PVG93_01190 [Phycisphaerales bacterium]
MITVKCPMCGKKFGSYLMGLARPAYGSVFCSNCNQRLELLNPGICHFIGGVIFAVLLIGIVIMSVPYLWLWVMVIGLFCWLLNPVIVWLLGSWGIWSYDIAKAARLRFLAAAQAVSAIVAGVTALYIAFYLLGPYWRLLTNIEAGESQLADSVEEYKRIFSFEGIIGLTIGFISVATATTTKAMRKALRTSAGR